MENGFSWDQLHMTSVFLTASKSKDPRTHIGAVIVDKHNHPVSSGFNGLPRKVKDLPERYNDRHLKKFFMEHAERNAIYAANESLEGCTLYSNFFPCCECARAIIQSGIAEVVVHKEFSEHDDLSQYKERIEASKLMFSEAGIIVRYWHGDIIPITGRRAGIDVSL